jgi:hypothetical protein
MIVLLTATDRLGADLANCAYVGDGEDGELAGGTAVGLTRPRISELNDTDPNLARAHAHRLPRPVGPAAPPIWEPSDRQRGDREATLTPASAFLAAAAVQPAQPKQQPQRRQYEVPVGIRARGLASGSLRIPLTALPAAPGLQQPGVEVDTVGEFLDGVGVDRPAGRPGTRDDRTVLANLRGRPTAPTTAQVRRLLDAVG